MNPYKPISSGEVVKDRVTGMGRAQCNGAQEQRAGKQGGGVEMLGARAPGAVEELLLSGPLPVSPWGAAVNTGEGALSRHALGPVPSTPQWGSTERLPAHALPVGCR